MPGYIDIHFHQVPVKAREGCCILNLPYPSNPEAFTANHLLSVGLHPWDTGAAEFDPDIFEQMASHPNVVAIGEAGLDRLKGASLDIQSGLFRSQANIAEKLGKPVIIHCVKAWEELIRLRIRIKPQVGWIIHGFRGKPELAAQLVRHGFYLSFGPSLLDEATGLTETFTRVPDERIFLETDEGEAGIREVYERAADIRNIGIDRLQEIININFTAIFGSNVHTRMAPSH